MNVPVYMHFISWTSCWLSYGIDLIAVYSCYHVLAFTLLVYLLCIYFMDAWYSGLDILEELGCSEVSE